MAGEHDDLVFAVALAYWAVRIPRDGDRRSNPMPISVPNYNRKTDRLQFGTLIGITSES